MVDSLNIAREWLIDPTTTLWDAIGNPPPAGEKNNARVWPDRLPPNFDNSTLSALVINLDEEGTEGNGAVHDCVLVVWAYASLNTIKAVRALYGLVWDRLQLASGTTSAGNIVQVTHASSLGVRTDPEAKHLFHASRWNLRTEEG